MTKNRDIKAICLSILFITHSVYCQDGSVLREKAATRASNYASTYLSKTQWITLFDYGIEQMIGGNPVANVGTNLMAKMIGVVTVGQMADATAFGVVLTLNLGLFTGIATFLSRTSTVIGNNLNGIFNQIQQRSVTMRANGKTHQEIINQSYQMGLEFFTAKQIDSSDNSKLLNGIESIPT